MTSVDTLANSENTIRSNKVSTGWVMRTQIRKIGNSLGNIIPVGIIRQLNLEEGTEIEVQTEGNRIIIEPVKKKTRERLRFSEQELLNGMNPYLAHADELANITAAELGE